MPLVARTKERPNQRQQSSLRCQHLAHHEGIARAVGDTDVGKIRTQRVDAPTAQRSHRGTRRGDAGFEVLIGVSVAAGPKGSAAVSLTARYPSTTPPIRTQPVPLNCCNCICLIGA